MAKLISVTPKADYTLLLKYDDGLEGEYSCSEVMKKEEYYKLKDVQIFNSVEIDFKSNDVCWQGDTYLCKNALYKHLELQRLMNVFKIDLNKL